MENTGIGQNGMAHMDKFLNGGNTTVEKPQPPIDTKTDEPEKPVKEPAKPDASTEPPVTQPTEPVTTGPTGVDKSKEPEKKVDENKPASTEPTTPTEQKPELNDDLILNYFKEKHGKEYGSIEDMFKPVDQAPVDPWANVSDEVVQFKKYNEETGRGFEDFVKLNRDVTKLDPIQLAREKVSGIVPDLTAKQIDEYLENKLNIDVSNPNEMSVSDRIELESFVRDYRDQLKSDQEKYRQPIERPQQPTQSELKDLGNGLKISEEDWQKFQNNRNQYINNLKSSTDKITNSVFEVKVDDNGSEKTIQVGYEYSKDDKHRMVSDAEDTQAAFGKMFTNEKGEVDYVGLQEAMFWANPELRAKAISHLVHKTRAEQLKEFTKSRTNANFQPRQNLPNNGAQQTKTVPIPGTTNAFGLKHDFSQFLKKSS